MLLNSAISMYQNILIRVSLYIAKKKITNLVCVVSKNMLKLMKICIYQEYLFTQFSELQRNDSCIFHNYLLMYTYFKHFLKKKLLTKQAKLV